MKNTNLLTTADRIVTIAVDIQNDFCPGGSLAVPNGDRVVEPMNRMMRLTRALGGIVVATRDWHPEQTPHFNDWQGPGPAGIWPRHCVAGTEGAAFHPNLDLQPSDIIVSKGTGLTDDYSGFDGRADDGRTFEEIIRPDEKYGRTLYILGGLATDYCVKATGISLGEAANRWRRETGNAIDIIGIRDAMRAVKLQPYDETEAIDAMWHAGIQMTDSHTITNQYAELAGV